MRAQQLGAFPGLDRVKPLSGQFRRQDDRPLARTRFEAMNYVF
ncbi:hypothetical protein C4K04_2991 [Pseudomonas chlororaphis]|uniref:Uncharacterized protein n=1 Tax=Pseudomonas chlororaphis TaxID=587753 RepID=A0A3G7TNJ1_9PSED|nr:hypothetical protein C4K04_2991 [Pseudomonas chlororaphis]